MSKSNRSLTVANGQRNLVMLVCMVNPDAESEEDALLWWHLPILAWNIDPPARIEAVSIYEPISPFVMVATANTLTNEVYFGDDPVPWGMGKAIDRLWRLLWQQNTDKPLPARLR